MKWLTKLSSYRADREPLEGELPKFWDESRISIYEFLASHSSGVDRSQLTLPDEKQENGKLRFSAGAMDGAFGHHGGGGKENAQEVFSALHGVCKLLTSVNLKRFYELLLQDGKALGVADSLAGLLATYSAIDVVNLSRIALWLAKCSPDREPVKFGIILLGCLKTIEPSVDVLITLGHHDEFTLYSAVALGKQLNGSERERSLWQLAKEVHGWGRIQIVERLAGTQDAEIKTWMLHEGYKNEVMYEYVAYICATTGGLVEALRAKEPDMALLAGVGDILESLMLGGPAEDMHDYVDGVEAIQLFMGHVARISPRLPDLLTIDAIKRFVEYEEWDWTKLEKNGWSSDIRKHCASVADELSAKPEWRQLVEEALLNTADDRAFWVATRAARIIGLDPWENQFERQKNDKSSHQWFFLMQTQDRDRVARVVELAEQYLDLSLIARGPTLEVIGVGPNFEQHSILDFVLQDIDRFPGLGWPLVAAGLASPFIRNRNMALKALARWPRDIWPDQAPEVLACALAREPDDEIRERIREVMDGIR